MSLVWSRMERSWKFPGPVSPSVSRLHATCPPENESAMKIQPNSVRQSAHVVLHTGIMSTTPIELDTQPKWTFSIGKLNEQMLVSRE